MTKTRRLTGGGFFAPVSLLVLVMFVYFLWTYILLKRHPDRKYELRVLREEQQQLSFSESNHHSNNSGASGPPGDCPPFATGMSVLGNEHSFKSQLRATAFTLFLFLATWALAALAVSLGHFLDMIFSCLYGAFCVTLGLFLLIQHCAKRDDVWHQWWACCLSKSKTEDGDLDGQSQRQELHQSHCHLSSPCSGKQPLLSPQLVQSSYHKKTPPSQSPTPSHTGPFCVAMMGPVTQTSISSLTEPIPSLCSPSLSGELPPPTLPLQSCLNNRAKSRSFNRPRPCLQDYHSHVTSTSMEGSVYSSHPDSPHTVHYHDSPPLVSNSPQPDIFPCASSQLDKQLASCHSLQRQTSCQSIQDSVTSCHRHAHNMHDSMTSFHSLLLPSHGFHTCQWHMYNSADHSSTTSCCEKPNPFTLQYQQDREKDLLCRETEQQDFPRNTLPRHHSTVGRRGAIGRNSSLQEDGLLGSDTTGTIRTGPWKNETTV